MLTHSACLEVTVHKATFRYPLRIVQGLLLLSLAACLLIPSLGSGETFPEVPLPAPQDPVQRRYLGLQNDQPFTLRQVEGKVVLVEILNILCPHCRKQTKPYNQLYEMIEADPATRGRIKMLGVAVANDREDIEDFVEVYEVAFPVVSDRHFDLHRALNAGRTPFTLYVLRDQPGDIGVIADTHLGGDDKMDELFAYLKQMLVMQTSDFTSLPDLEQADAEVLAPPQSEAEVVQMVTAAFASQGEALDDVTPLKLKSGRQVYTASVVRGGKRVPLFAEVASRSAICDICHSVHFFYVFDADGTVLSFEPLHLTKYGNVEWTPDEVAQFTRRVVGKKLGGGWQFDRKVDAVTSATMTSAIIFDDLRQGQELLEELHREGWL